MNYYHEINELKSKNSKVKTQSGRVRVLKDNYTDLLNSLQYMADHKALHSKDDSYNPYYKMIDEISTWVTRGSTNQEKNYKTHLKNENPSDIKPNMKTNQRICKDRSNYCLDEPLKPTENELKDKYIKQLVDTLHYYQRCHKNRFKVHKAIREAKNDLNEAIMSKRGINHDKRTDNEPDVKPEPVIEPLDLKNLINSNNIIKAYFDGYSELEIGEMNNINQSSVSRQLKACHETRLAKN